MNITSGLDKIEVVSFEHLIERSPTRTNELWSGYRQAVSAANMPQRGGILRPTPYSPERHQAVKTAKQEFARQLADTLTQSPVTVLKCVDESSVSIYELAKEPKLIDKVTLSASTQVKVQDKFEEKDLLEVELENAFITDFQVVGAYALQPWLGMNPDLWASGDHHDIGPMEKIVFDYENITWKGNGTKRFNCNNVKERG